MKLILTTAFLSSLTFAAQDPAQFWPRFAACSSDAAEAKVLGEMVIFAEELKVDVEESKLKVTLKDYETKALIGTSQGAITNVLLAIDSEEKEKRVSFSAKYELGGSEVVLTGSFLEGKVYGKGSIKLGKEFPLNCKLWTAP